MMNWLPLWVSIVACFSLSKAWDESSSACTNCCEDFGDHWPSADAPPGAYFLKQYIGCLRDHTAGDQLGEFTSCLNMLKPKSPVGTSFLNIDGTGRRLASRHLLLLNGTSSRSLLASNPTECCNDFHQHWLRMINVRGCMKDHCSYKSGADDAILNSRYSQCLNNKLKLGWPNYSFYGCDGVCVDASTQAPISDSTAVASSASQTCALGFQAFPFSSPGRRLLKKDDIANFTSKAQREAFERMVALWAFRGVEDRGRGTLLTGSAATDTAGWRIDQQADAAYRDTPNGFVRIIPYAVQFGNRPNPDTSNTYAAIVVPVNLAVSTPTPIRNAFLQSANKSVVAYMVQNLVQPIQPIFAAFCHDPQS